MITALAETRGATQELVAPLSDAQLETQYTPILSPLAWDLAHIAAYEDLWIAHRHGGEPLLRPDLAAMYDAFETPRPLRGSLPLLDAAGARAYLDEVRARTFDVLGRRGEAGGRWRGLWPRQRDGTLVELVLRHEQQHAETMLQALELARVDGYVPVRRDPLPFPPRGAVADDPLDLVAVPGGPCLVGAPAAGFAYDNERPRHRVDVPAFRIGRRPVTTASWLRFAEGGGYERREWWSDEGWAWKEEYDITAPEGWSGDGREWRITGWEPLVDAAPVCHVSWFEADAFARSLGARLPTELEWEKAATWDQGTQPEATLGQRAFAPAPAGSRPGSASVYGCEQLLGDVWEWTASQFDGYPGFRAHPYPEYSEIFFGQRMFVLRGGAWATAARVATPTFRNWDLPQRRQIFAGLRLAADA